MESREVRLDRFRRLAAKRTNEVLKKLDILAHCANRHGYDFDKEQIDQIFVAVEKKISDVRNKFKFVEEEAFKL